MNGGIMRCSDTQARIMGLILMQKDGMIKDDI